MSGATKPEDGAMIHPFPVVPSIDRIVRIAADHHVHSTFSDGAGSVMENVRAAERLGLGFLGCVDHVRRATDWLPRYVAEVRRASALTSVRLSAGVEAKILDTDGGLDLPPAIDGVDRVLAADHQVPTPRGPASPREVHAELVGGRLSRCVVVDWLVEGTARAMERHPGLLLAHLFSVLPKIGVDGACVSDAALLRLSATARDTGAAVEISERWRCPDQRALQAFREAGVPVVPSTDAHSPEAIGRYEYVDAQRWAVQVTAS